MGKKKCFDDKWIVITGAAGLIGSCVVKQLNELGFAKNLLLVDDFKESIKWKNLQGKKYGDFISRFALDDWICDNRSDVEAIIHLGANSSTVGTDGDEYYRMNYRYTVDLARFAIDHGMRFIYASSAATYGVGEGGFSDDDANLDSLRPLNLYGQSKQMVDLWALRAEVLDKVVGLKYFNVYGPNEYHKGRMASMVLHMYHQICKDGKVRLFKSNTAKFGDGDQQRDFIYVKDVAKITCDFLFNDITGIYNVGLGVPRSWNELARAIFAAMKKPPVIEYIPMPEDLVKNYQNYTCAEMVKLESKMKLPKTSLEDGVKDYVQNYLCKEARW